MGLVRVATVAAVATLALGCAPRRAVRATLPQLQMRAVFDLGCHVSQLQLYHVDRVTKVIAGCGRRLTYQERCTDVGSRRLECSWRIDSPRAGQELWPDQPVGPAAGVVSTQCPAPPSPGPMAEGRAIYTDLFRDREAARTTPPSPVPKKAEGRSIKTQLLDPQMLETR